MPREPKIKGTFCEKQVELKKRFDSQSFRWKRSRSGKAWLLIGCPVGKWQPRKKWRHCRTDAGRRRCTHQVGKCKVGTKLFKILLPAGARCPIGTRRMTKG